MERNKKFKKFGDRTSKGNEKKKKNEVHKKKLGGAAALQLLCTSRHWLALLVFTESP